jgi:hypothetical protein
VQHLVDGTTTTLGHVLTSIKSATQPVNVVINIDLTHDLTETLAANADVCIEASSSKTVLLNAPTGQRHANVPTSRHLVLANMKVSVTTVVCDVQFPPHLLVMVEPDEVRVIWASLCGLPD